MFKQLEDRLLKDEASRLSEISKATGISSQRIAYASITQLKGKPELWPVVKANASSFVNAVLAACEQGLDFSKPNEVHLVPYKGNDPKIVLQRGYKGWLKLARRSPDVEDVDAFAIYKNDKYKRARGANQYVEHTPAALGQVPGELVGFCAFAVNKTGRVKFEEMSTEEIEEHVGRYVKAAERGPFAGIIREGRKHPNFEIYGLKTVIIRLCNRQLDLTSDTAMAMSEEFEPEQVAIATAVTRDDRSAEFVDIEEVSEPVADSLSPEYLSEGELRGREINALDPDALITYMERFGDRISDGERDRILMVINETSEEVA